MSKKTTKKSSLEKRLLQRALRSIGPAYLLTALIDQMEQLEQECQDGLEKCQEELSYEKQFNRSNIHLQQVLKEDMKQLKGEVKKVQNIIKSLKECHQSVEKENW